jgi:hypothetical protein
MAADRSMQSRRQPARINRRGFLRAAICSALAVGAPAAKAAEEPDPLQMPAPEPEAAESDPAAAVPAQSGAERRVKAAFLYKFLGYTEFPPAAFSDASSPLLLGVAGSEEMLAELERTVAGRTVQGRPITVKSVREGDNPGMLHMLFVAGDGTHAARLLRAATGAMLLVSECEGGLAYGSVINFKVVDEHVRFDVSLDAAEKNNVRLSSRLLNVANHVQKGNI